MRVETKYTSKVSSLVNRIDVGMAYQRAPFDPFLNATQCQLDAQLMQYLGVNVIRSISPS